MDHHKDDEIIIPEMSFAFLEVSLELSALKDYWNTVERQLRTRVEEATDRLFHEWLGPNANEQISTWRVRRSQLLHNLSCQECSGPLY